MIKLCLNPKGQPLPLVLFTMFLSLLPISDGSYLLASDAGISADKSEISKSKYHHPPPIPFQVEEGDPVQPTIIWDKTIGGSSEDYLNKILSTPDGSYLLAGTSSSNASGDKSEDNKGRQGYYTDYWVVKINADGNKIWDKTFGADETDVLSSVIFTPDGGYLLAGHSDSDASDDKSEDSKGLIDYWVIKIDGDGNKIWDKTFGGSERDLLSTAILTPDGGYLLVGSSTSGASGDKSENNKGEYDYWIVKIDADGTKIWDKTVGGSGVDNPSTALPTSDGGYLLSGRSISNASGDKSENNKGEYDYWIVKIDADGNKVWDKTIGGSNYDALSSAILTPDSGYLLAGASSSDASGDKSENRKSVYNYMLDFWIVKIDADGDILWDKTFGGENSDSPGTVISTPDGGYLIAGSSFSDASGDKSENSKDNDPEDYERIGDYWIVKIDAEGSKVWDKTIGGGSSDGLSDAILTPDGDYLLAGTSASNASGDKSENSKSRDYKEDYWIVKITDVTTPIVTTLTLIDAETDQDIQELKEADLVLNNGLLNIRANSFPEMTDRLAFELTGPISHSRVEKVPPYALFGDTQGDYGGKQLPEGKYTLTVTPYSKDEKGNAFTLFFRVLYNEPVQSYIEWDKTIGGSGGDGANSAIPTPDGGYLLAGTSDSDTSGDKSENSKGEEDYWLVKVNAEGNKIWDKTFGGSGDDRAESIISASDDSYLLAGSSRSDASGDKSENSKGSYDYWIVKIDANGNKIWDKTFGGSNEDRASSVIPTPDGGYLLAGYSYSGISGDKSENSKGYYDYWVVKIDANGTKIWDKTFGGSDYDYLESAISTPDGGYLLVGYSWFEAGENKGEINGWVVKIDVNGNKVWDKTFGGSEYDYLFNATLTSDGGYLLAGYSESDISGDKSEDSKGSNDYWVIKIDANGNKIWDKTFGGQENDRASSVIPSPDGSYLLAGISRSNASGDKSENNKGNKALYDYWVIKIDADGDKVWDKTFGGSEGEGIPNAIPTFDGGYLLAGSSSSNASGDKSEDSKGGSDYWIVKLKGDATSGVTTLTLIDAATDQDIQELKQGDVIPLHSGLLNIRANTLGPIDRVTLKLQGPVNHNRTESEAPYALFGDNQGNYGGKVLKAGMYTITATPYSEDKKGNALTVSFEVKEVAVISGFTLINATRDQVVGTLSQGEVIDLASYGNHQLTIRAETKAMNLEKVALVLQGPINQSITEKVPPYALFGDQPASDGSPNYKGVKWKPGEYTLTATPYPDGSMDTPSTISFSVIDSRGLSAEATSLRTEIYPVPTSGIVNIMHDGEREGAQLLLMDFDGNQLLSQPMGAQPVEQVDMSSFRKGIYYLKVISPEGVQIFRVVKE